MRRDLSMVRRLEKIEKEIGYCEIKLEKEQRLRAQAHFLRVHRDGLQEAVDGFYRSQAGEDGEGNQLGGLTLREVFDQVSIAPGGEKAQRLQEKFRCAGSLPFLTEELQVLDQALGDLDTRLATFDAFRVKKQGLIDERDEALNTFIRSDYEPLLEISAEFERIEQSWNTLTEDLMNMDEAIFHVSRAGDYLGSARNFILASRSQFNVESWLRTGYLIDLFKHSSVGRAKEMVEGADRNLKAALVELLCLEDVVVRPSDFEHMLLPFLDSLFDDLFCRGKLKSTLAFLEQRCADLERLKGELEANRETILESQTEQEESRVRLFNKMGDERKRLTLAQ